MPSTLKAKSGYYQALLLDRSTAKYLKRFTMNLKRYFMNKRSRGKNLANPAWDA
jgi:hypothetical protein